jgi:hypothetical protein
MDNPLTTADYTALNKASYNLNRVRTMIEDAKRAGVPDLEQHCINCDYTEQRIQQLKQVYFKGKP